MNDFTLILNEILKFLNTQFNVFGFNLTLSGVLFGSVVISFVCYAVRKMYM
jgi:hypothetical protein